MMQNAPNYHQFTYSIKLDVKEPETSTYIMKGPNVAEWVRAIKEELD